MAVILTMNYSKKLGLPNFSSHSCSVSIQSEVADLSQVTGEVKRLYAAPRTSEQEDRTKSQTLGASPAEPGDLLLDFSVVFRTP